MSRESRTQRGGILSLFLFLLLSLVKEVRSTFLFKCAQRILVVLIVFAVKIVVKLKRCCWNISAASRISGSYYNSLCYIEPIARECVDFSFALKMSIILFFGCSFFATFL